MPTGDSLMTVERVIQLAIAPAFVLGSIMAVLNLLFGRLHRLLDHKDALGNGQAEGAAERELLRRRTRLLFNAIAACIVAAVLICLLVIVSFIEPVFGFHAGMHLAGLLVSGLAALTAALVLFLCEIVLSGRHLPHRSQT